MSASKPLPVYTVTDVAHGFAVLRDSATFKTPADSDLILPTKILAETIAQECREQTKQSGKAKIDPAALPMLQLAWTTIDIVRKKRDAIIDQLCNFIGSELLCHRAESPAGLVKHQQDVWQPLLDWCEKYFGAKLDCGTGIMPISQSGKTAEKLRAAISHYDDFRLTGLRQAADLSGSLVLAFALAEKHLIAQQVFDAAELDASFQIEKWGEDPALASHRASLLKDMGHCEEWFSLIK